MRITSTSSSYPRRVCSFDSVVARIDVSQGFESFGHERLDRGAAVRILVHFQKDLLVVEMEENPVSRAPAVLQLFDLFIRELPALKKVRISNRMENLRREPKRLY